MKSSSLARTALGVVTMGAAALFTTPELALAACRERCVDECPAHPDTYCESWNCPGEGASCSSSATECTEVGYKMTCASEAN